MAPRTQPRSGSAGKLPWSVSLTGHRKLGLGASSPHRLGAHPAPSRCHADDWIPVQRAALSLRGAGCHPTAPPPTPGILTHYPSWSPRPARRGGEGGLGHLWNRAGEGLSSWALPCARAPGKRTGPAFLRGPAPTWVWARACVLARGVALPLLKQGLPGLRPRRAGQRLRPDQLPAPGLGGGRWRPRCHQGWAEERENPRVGNIPAHSGPGPPSPQ